MNPESWTREDADFLDQWYASVNAANIVADATRDELADQAERELALEMGFEPFGNENYDAFWARAALERELEILAELPPLQSVELV